jgi:hypothetical protein
MSKQTNISLFAVYSCVNTSPRIHQVLPTEQEAKDKLLEYVHLLTKSENIPADQSVFPCLTYKVLENKSIEIHEHSKVEKIEKGWVWNGKKSEIESKTIGSFQVISIENDFVIPEPKQTETDKLVNKLIDEMIDNICDMKIEDIEYEKEEVKNLDKMFVPFFDEVKTIKTDPVETIKDLSPSPISRLSSRSSTKRRRPNSIKMTRAEIPSSPRHKYLY